MKSHGLQHLTASIYNLQFITWNILTVGLHLIRQVIFYFIHEGTIYFWDLLNGIPLRKFKCKYYSSVNILCEIAALNIIAIVQ